MIPFLLSIVGSFVVMLSLIHYLISMSTNQAFIKIDVPAYVSEETGSAPKAVAEVCAYQIEETKM